MKRAAIATITKDEISDLISSGVWGSISEDQSENLRRWLVNTTMMWCGRVNGEIVCVFGVVPPTMLSDTAYLWLWDTEKMQEHKFLFVRKSQIVIKELLTRWPKLVGMCRADAAASIRWMRWLGGETGEPNQGFVPFVIRGD